MLVLRWLMACGLVFGGLAWAARFVRRMVPGGAESRDPLARLGSLSLGPRRTLLVIKIGGEVRALLFHEHGVLDMGLVSDWPQHPERALPDGSPGPGEGAGTRATAWVTGAAARLSVHSRARLQGLLRPQGNAAHASALVSSRTDWLSRREIMRPTALRTDVPRRMDEEPEAGREQ